MTEPIFTLANQLTLLRMLLIPAFVLLVVYGYFGWALIVFIIAGATDAFDGLIARQAGQKTTLGAWLDPAADKLLLRDDVHRADAAQSRAGQPHSDLADGARHQPRRRHRAHRGDRQSRHRPAHVQAVAARQGRDRVLHRDVRGRDVLQLLGRTSPVVDVFIWASLAITLASGIDYVFRVAKIINQ